MHATVARYFPLLVLALTGFAYARPAPFVAAGPAIVPLLMLVMLGMGMTLSTTDFTAIARAPRLVALGVLLHYTVMPAAAWLVIRVLGLDAETAVGVVLVGATSAGTASNVISYLARGNVALSVTMTACSTLLAVVLLPAIAWLLLGRRVPVPHPHGKPRLARRKCVIATGCKGGVNTGPHELHRAPHGGAHHRKLDNRPALLPEP